MNVCSHPNCIAEGTECRDFTCGPLYDLRWVCREHLGWAEIELSKSEAERTITYYTSVIKATRSRARKTVSHAIQEIRKARERLEILTRNWK